MNIMFTREYFEKVLNSSREDIIDYILCYFSAKDQQKYISQERFEELREKFDFDKKVLDFFSGKIPEWKHLLEAYKNNSLDKKYGKYEIFVAAAITWNKEIEKWKTSGSKTPPRYMPRNWVKDYNAFQKTHALKTVSEVCSAIQNYMMTVCDAYSWYNYLWSFSEFCQRAGALRFYPGIYDYKRYVRGNNWKGKKLKITHAELSERQFGMKRPDVR